MPSSSCMKRCLAISSVKLTVVVADLGEQHEQLLAAEQLHHEEDLAGRRVDQQLVHLDHVLVREVLEVLELLADVRQHLLVARLDDLHRELVAGRQLGAALDEPDRSLLSPPRPAPRARRSACRRSRPVDGVPAASSSPARRCSGGTGRRCWCLSTARRRRLLNSLWQNDCFMRIIARELAFSGLSSIAFYSCEILF